MTTKEAMDHLRQAWKDDPDYRHGWIANLTMSVYDEFLHYERSSEEIHKTAERAAERFMNLLEKP